MEHMLHRTTDIERMTMDLIAELRLRLLHNHSTTNLYVYGPRPIGECPACDRTRRAIEEAVERYRRVS